MLDSRRSLKLGLRGLGNCSSLSLSCSFSRSTSLSSTLSFVSCHFLAADCIYAQFLTLRFAIDSEFSAFPIVFQQQRGWSPGIGGLAFLGILVGIIIALLFVVFFENPRYVRISRAHGGVAPPEARLFSAMIGSPLLTIGLVWFAASIAPSTFWLVPIIGTAPFGAGVVLTFLSINNYLIESYVLYASSVLAANSLLRSLFGMAFPLL